MLPLQRKKQTIIVTCLIEHNNKILLLRGSEYANDVCKAYAGYFVLPRFTLPFGGNPAELISAELKEQFGQSVKNMKVLTITEHMTDQTTQIIELVYGISVNKARSRHGRFSFIGKDKLKDFLFPDEIKRIQTYFSKRKNR